MAASDTEQDWLEGNDSRTTMERQHAFRATERVPGWCVRCGEAAWTGSHTHRASTCRPETRGGTDYDPCGVATS